MILGRSGLTLLSLAIALGAGAPRPASAQEPVGPDGEPLPMPQARDVRTYFSNNDAGTSGLRSVGLFNRVCTENYTGIFGYIDPAWNCTPFLEVNSKGFVNAYYRGARWGFGVPRSQWLAAKALVPALDNILGAANDTTAGWTIADIGAGNFDDTGPADGGLGLRFAGVRTTTDNTCRDHGETAPAGVPLLAGSDCPETWGSEGFRGGRPIPLELWKQRFDGSPATHNWDFWRVSEGEILGAGVDPNKFLGSFQTYTYTSDYSENVLCGGGAQRNYAHLFPGRCGTVQGTARSGWPLGIEIRTEAFTFQLPAIKDAAFYQITFTNRSRDLYGVPIDYDSLYISLLYGVFSNLGQQAAVYDIIEWNARVGMGETANPCDATRNITDITCARLSTQPFDQGAMALIVLKSPIGDMRNKLYAQTSGPFFNPGHPNAGDTITYNHSHMCGFRACGANTYALAATNVEIERRGFGMLSSTEANVLGRRDPASTTAISDNVWWHTFRNHGFPFRWAPGQDPALGGGFNRYVPPGNWDYNKDGVLDTLHFDSCHLAGCVTTWGDTLPNGKLNGYTNTHGNAGVGPIRLPADSTVGFVLAIAAASDSLGMMTIIPAVIDHYLNFYLGPEAPVKCEVAGVTRSPAADGTQLSFIWDEACFPGNWTDPFLAKQAQDIATAPVGGLATLRQLNPWLDDTLAFLAENNLAALHVFKSCDGGATWTDDADCEGDPVSVGEFAGLGYLPLESYDANFPLPTRFVDANVLAGFTYTYNVVGETRGAEFQVLNGDAVGVNAGGDTVCTLNCRVETVVYAPALFNALSPSTGEPNVVQAYMPASIPAGGTRWTVAVTDSTGPMPSDRLAIIGTTDGDDVSAATYRVLFGPSATGFNARTYDVGSKALTGSASRVILTRGATADTISGSNAGGYSVSGGRLDSTTVVVGAGDSVVTEYRSWPDSATGRRPVMVLALTGTGGGALLVSNSLTGASATPGAYHGNADYAGFDLSIDRALSNRLQGQHWENADGSVVTVVTEPTAAWFATPSRADSVNSGNQANGEYAFTWQDRPYGPNEPFTLNTSDPGVTQQAILASLDARAVAATGNVSDSVAARIAAAGNPGFTVDSLVAVELPFRVRNLSYGRDVVIAMRKRPGKRILVGTGTDTTSVLVPDNVWVPGDSLFFLEPNTVSGNLVVTFRPAVVACDPTAYTRTSCNPLRGLTTGASVYLGATAGQVQRVRYHTPITGLSTFEFETQPPQQTQTADAIATGLAAVKVVPNPYIVLSQYPGNVLKFTHMPPKGLLRIFTVSGQFVQQITWDDAQAGQSLGGTGDLDWNLRSREGVSVGGGMYIYVVTALDAQDRPLGEKRGKFVIIR